MNNEDSKLDLKLINEIGNENILELTTDYAEIGLDFFIDNEALKEVPFFGTFYKIYKSAINIKDQIFLKKIHSFLFFIKDIPIEKRINFIKEIDKEKQKFGEKLILLIDKLDDFNKPKLLSNLFKAFIEGNLTKEEFLIMSNSLTNSYIDDLISLKEMTVSQAVMERLAYNGIYTITINGANSKSSINRLKTGLGRPATRSNFGLTEKQTLIEIPKGEVNFDFNRLGTKLIDTNPNENIFIELNFSLSEIGIKMKQYLF